MYIINVEKKIKSIMRKSYVGDFCWDRIECKDFKTLIENIEKSEKSTNKGNIEKQIYEKETEGLRGIQHSLSITVFINNKPLMQLNLSNYKDILNMLSDYNVIDRIYVCYDGNSIHDVYTEYGIYLKSNKEIVFNEDGTYFKLT